MPIKEFVPCCNDLHDCNCAQIHRKLQEAKDPATWKSGFGAEYFSTEYLEDQFTSAYTACLDQRYENPTPEDLLAAGAKMSTNES